MPAVNEGLGRTFAEFAAFGPLERSDDRLALRFVSVERVGDDLWLIARHVEPAARRSRRGGALTAAAAPQGA